MDQALISCAGGIFALDVSTGNVGWQLNDTNSALVVCPVGVDNRIICAPHSSKALVHFWKLHKETGVPESSGNPVYKCSAPEKFSDLIFSSCGGLMFAGATSGTMFVWQTWTGNLLKSWTAHFGAITKLVLSSDDSTLFTGSEDTTVKVWDLPSVFTEGTVKPKISLTAHTAGITDLILDDTLLITSSKDKCVKKFRLTNNTIVQEQKWVLDSPVLRIAGNLFAGCEDGKIVKLGTTTETLLGQHSGTVTGLGVSLDQSRLVSCSGDGVKIWDTNANILLHTVLGPQQQLKNAVGLLMKVASSHSRGGLVNAIDSYLQFKPLSRVLTKIDAIDKIPLLCVPEKSSQKVKADKLFCVDREHVESTIVDPAAELEKQRTLAHVWAKTAADLLLQVAALNGGDVVLELPLKTEATKKSRNK